MVPSAQRLTYSPLSPGYFFLSFYLTCSLLLHRLILAFFSPFIYFFFTNSFFLFFFCSSILIEASPLSLFILPSSILLLLPACVFTFYIVFVSFLSLVFLFSLFLFLFFTRCFFPLTCCSLFSLTSFLCYSPSVLPFTSLPLSISILICFPALLPFPFHSSVPLFPYPLRHV